jgi:glycerophosphoryl diester phosphodiesterase
VKFPAALLLSKAPSVEQLPELRADFDAVAVMKDGCLRVDSAEWIREAHRIGLGVIAWTFDDAKFDTTRYHSSGEEIQSVFRNGVDGIFTDFPASGIQARKTAGRIAE